MYPPPPRFTHGQGWAPGTLCFSCEETWLTYVCPKLVRAGLSTWRDLVPSGMV